MIMAMLPAILVRSLKKLPISKMKKKIKKKKKKYQVIILMVIADSFI